MNGLARSAALSQKAALQMPFPFTTPPVKMEQRNARRRSVAPKFKIILPLMMAKAHAAAIFNQKTPDFSTRSTKQVENISPALLEWFYKNRRSLPFRENPTPYHVWLSEVMLQQTRVSAVLPYYYRFLEALPDIPALAACEEEKLHKLWEGLGYYSRVRNLQKAAKLVCAQYGGQLPADYAALRALPGIGEYTAGAIASISFGLPVPAVDGNVLRVFSRLYNDPGVITEPAVKKAFTARVMEHQPPEKAGDYNQALMELGALVCVPNGAPLCGQCPLATLCRARAAGTTAQLPQKAKPKPRKLVPVTLALVESPAGFLVQQRPEKGLLAGLWQPVLWEGEHLLQAEVLARLAALGLDTGTAAPAALPAAKHIFTHIEWLMSGVQLHVAAQSAPAGYVWASREQLRTTYTLPGAFRAYKPLLL